MSSLTYDAEGAARMTGLSVDVIKKAWRAGDLPAVASPHAPSKPLYRHDDLAAYVATFIPHEPRRAPRS